MISCIKATSPLVACFVLLAGCSTRDTAVSPSPLQGTPVSDAEVAPEDEQESNPVAVSNSEMVLARNDPNLDGILFDGQTIEISRTTSEQGDFILFSPRAIDAHSTGGTSTPTEHEGNSEPQGGRFDRSLRTLRAELDLTPYIRVQVESAEDANRSRQFAGLYTRVRIVGSFCEDASTCSLDALTSSGSVPDARQNSETRTLLTDNERATPRLRDYTDERRSWFQRWIWGRQSTKSAVINIQIDEVNLQATAPLLTLSHESTRAAGERFVTRTGLELIPTQYFRIVPGARVNTSIGVRMSEEVSSDAVATTLDTATRALGLIATKSTLLTELNRDRVSSAAAFVDETLNTLLSEAVQEHIPVVIPVDEWLLYGVLVTVEIKAPAIPSDSPTRTEIADLRTVGYWRIWMEEPRISIWSEVTSKDMQIATDADRWEAYADGISASLSYLSPSEVSGFSIAENVTIGAHLASQSWYQPAVAALTQANTDIEINNAAASFCRHVTDEAINQRFNTLDSHIVLWAASMAPSITQSTTEKLQRENGGCSEAMSYIRKLGLIAASTDT